MIYASKILLIAICCGSILVSDKSSFISMIFFFKNLTKSFVVPKQFYSAD